MLPGLFGVLSTDDCKASNSRQPFAFDLSEEPADAMVHTRIIHPNIQLNEITREFSSAASSLLTLRMDFLKADSRCRIGGRQAGQR
jgi:hypothetical protein